MSTPITAALIKDLRDKTGIGMGKCKEALEEAHGDMELAICQPAQSRHGFGSEKRRTCNKRRHDRHSRK